MTAAEELDALRHSVAVVVREDAGHVLVSGPDTFSFLQVLVSADLDGIADGQGVRSLLLQPQGKLDVAFRLLRVGDDAWLDTDPGMGPQLASSLRRYLIRVKAEIVDRSAEWSTLSVIGPEADQAIRAPKPATLHAHVAADTPDGPARGVRTQHGYELVGSRARVSASLSRLRDAGVVEAGPVAYEAWRIEHGIPRQPADIDDSTIAQEAFLEDAVSFTKGCFIGQELVQRIDSRGHVNRFLRRLRVESGEWPLRGAEIVAGERVLGNVTSVAPRERPTGALGYVRREVEPPADVTLRCDTGTATATVLA
jgi:aminomethyltransferase